MNEILQYYAQSESIQENPITREALKWVGQPSRRHNMDECRGDRFEHGMFPETGFDCSAYVRYVLMHIDHPNNEAVRASLAEIRHCNEFFNDFGIFIHWGLHKSGDLVFFTRKGESPTHMGIVLDQDYYIHASGIAGSKVKISKLVQEPITTIRERQIYLYNPIGFKRPSLPEGRWQVAL